MKRHSVLVVGASFAGLTAAFWLTRAGNDVTLVEIAPAIREGGTPVNIKGDTIGVVEKMGLLEEIESSKIEIHKVEVWGRQGLTVNTNMPYEPEQHSEGVEYEIERDLLTRLMFALVKDDIEMIFDNSVTCLEEQASGISVDFLRGPRRTFDLVFGCDGIHSTVRKLWFGGTDAYARFLRTYGSVTIVPRLLIDQGSLAVYQAPGRSVILSAYNGKTDIITLFSSNYQIEYDRRDRVQQVALVSKHLKGEQWRVPELLGEIERASNFYFSDLSQIRMQEWTRGRVALVGDAAYCASAAAGMGGSLAINGAAAVGQAFADCDGDHVSAFRAYNETFRPFVAEVQAHAIKFCESLAAGQIF